MLADKIISSHLDAQMCHNYNKNVFSDIMAHRAIVFLQHGVIKDDLSNIYSKFKQKIDLFITSAKQEYLSILNNDNYGLLSNEVKLTGLARFDKLKNNPQKIITIMPTWRKEYFSLKANNWVCAVDFETTDYFKAYNAILTNQKLINALKKHDYKVEFIQHPLMMQKNNCFEASPFVDIKEAKNYTDIFERSSLLVTDYSSTAFDVAYLRKPVLYYHFDKEKFFANHSYKSGYFDYEQHGFGEVAYNAKDLIKYILEYVEQNCQIKEVYKERINNFFELDDKNSCSRITSEILKIKK
jgi:CDP-glycerol glycerophosphotransferase (TagB/SpsB family)